MHGSITLISLPAVAAALYFELRRNNLPEDPRSCNLFPDSCLEVTIGRSLLATCRLDRANLQPDFQRTANRVKNRSQVVHRRVSASRQHAVEALAVLVGLAGQCFKAHGRVRQVTKYQARRLRLAI